MRVRATFLCLVLLPACMDTGAGMDDGDGDGESDSTDTGGQAPDFDAEIQPILESGCLCHFSASAGGPMTAPYLNLNAGFAVGELVGVDSVQLASMKRVAPGDIDNSYLVHKLRGTHVDVGGPADTDTMPPLAPLAENDIAQIEAWILGGALP
jgi:hypothetical protein